MRAYKKASSNLSLSKIARGFITSSFLKQADSDVLRLPLSLVSPLPLANDIKYQNRIEQRNYIRPVKNIKKGGADPPLGIKNRFDRSWQQCLEPLEQSLMIDNFLNLAMPTGRY